MAEFRLESYDTTLSIKKVFAIIDDMTVCEIEIERVPSGEILIDVYPSTSRQHSYTTHHIPALIAALERAREIAAQWAAESEASDDNS